MEDIDLAEHWNETFSQLCCYIRKKKSITQSRAIYSYLVGLAFDNHQTDNFRIKICNARVELGITMMKKKKSPEVASPSCQDGFSAV